MPTKIAVIQKPPVLLDRDKTIVQAVELINEAASAGAVLLVFPEAYIPGYPAWIWRLKPGGDMALSSDLHAQLLLNPAGALLNRHRKLMPTNPERMVWGMGDATGLRVVETPAGRLGALICWESYMPLARYALYAQNLEIFVNPTWDKGEACQVTLRHIAREAGCWVIGTATALQGCDLPEDFPERDRLYTPDEWINDGDAVVVNPKGEIIAGPLHREKGILYAEIDVEAARRARRSLDVCGHYSRPDIFSLSVNRKPLQPAEFLD
jgi:nitrilase